MGKDREAVAFDRGGHHFVAVIIDMGSGERFTMEKLKFPRMSAYCLRNPLFAPGPWHDFFTSFPVLSRDDFDETDFTDCVKRADLGPVVVRLQGE